MKRKKETAETKNPEDTISTTGNDTGSNKKNKKKNNKKVIQELAKNYISREKSIVNQLTIQSSNHPLTVGTYREEVWKSLFESIVPKKYCIEQGIFIIDSKGNISSEVDLAIFDEMYTPYIFNCGKIKFIPIEAVAIVVQCKSIITGGVGMQDNLTEWVRSIDLLQTELNAVVRTLGDVSDTKYQDVDKSDKSLNDGKAGHGKETKVFTQTSTRPIKILCGTQFSSDNRIIRNSFDIILYLKDGRIVKEINGEKECFDKWYYMLNHYDHQNSQWEVPTDEEAAKKHMKKVCIHASRTLENLRIKDKNNKENVIMSLTFQLNQLLMLINNPMMFPHAAYVECFNEIFQNSDIQFDKQGD